MSFEIIFWLALIFIAYTYFGYPVLLYLWSRVKPAREPITGNDTPTNIGCHSS